MAEPAVGRYAVRLAEAKGCMGGSKVRPEDIQQTLDEMGAQGYVFRDMYFDSNLTCGKGTTKVAVMIFQAKT